MTMTTMYRHDTLKSSGTISKTLNDCNAPVYANRFCPHESVTIFSTQYLLVTDVLGGHAAYS